MNTSTEEIIKPPHDRKDTIIKSLIISILFCANILITFVIVHYVTAMQMRYNGVIGGENVIQYTAKGRYSLGEFLATTRDMGVIKIDVELELTDEDMFDQLRTHQGEIRNLINTILTSKTASELNILASTNELQGEIRDRINELISPYFLSVLPIPGLQKPMQVVRVNFETIYVRA